MPICHNCPVRSVGHIGVEAETGDRVSGTTTVAYEVVASRVSVLRYLVDEFLDDVHPALSSTRDRQDAARWTSLPECATFRSQYEAAIDASDAALRAVWDDIEALALNLQAAAAAMSDLDQTVRDNLTAILSRVQTERPSEYSDFTPDGRPVDLYTNITGGYAPVSGPPVTEDSSVATSDGTI
jgi:hypothetical protein